MTDDATAKLYVTYMSSQMEGNERKCRHIELSNSVINRQAGEPAGCDRPAGRAGHGALPHHLLRGRNRGPSSARHVHCTMYM